MDCLGGLPRCSPTTVSCHGGLPRHSPKADHPQTGYLRRCCMKRCLINPLNFISSSFQFQSYRNQMGRGKWENAGAGTKRWKTGGFFRGMGISRALFLSSIFQHKGRIVTLPSGNATQLKGESDSLVISPSEECRCFDC